MLLLVRLLGTLAATLVVLGLSSSALAQEDRWDAVIDLTFPIDGRVDFTDDYHHPRAGGRVHQATDLGRADPYGLQVHAAVGGTISFITGLTGDLHPGGWMIFIAGDDGRSYRYIHLGRQDGPASEAYAQGLGLGVRVERGQHIGYLGHSGNASPDWPHLHFEIHDPDVTDPYGSATRNPYRSLVASIERGDVPAARLLPIEVPAEAVPVNGDWNGDDIDQPGWFHDGYFYLQVEHERLIRFRYGRPGDQPVSGDWDGSGSDGIGVFRDGHWYLRNNLSSGPSWRHFRYGRAGDQPVAGDWQRLGRDGVGVFRGGWWYVRSHLSSGPSWRHFRYGRTGDVAVTGDWEGLDRDGVGVIRDNLWFLRSHLNSGPSTFHFPFGRVSDVPVSGRWTDQSHDAVGITRRLTWRLSSHLPAQSPDQIWP